MKRIPQNLKIIGFYAISLLFALFIYRITFFLLYQYRLDGASYLLVLKAFLIGFRFDFAVIAMILGPFALLSSIPFLNRFKIYRILWGYLPAPILLWLVGHLVGDLIYYENGNKHLGYEGFVFIGKDLVLLIWSALQNNTLITASGILIVAFALPLSLQLYRKWNPYQYNSTLWKKELLQIPVLLIVSVVAIRGGLQETPLRSSNAIISDNSFVNNIALNGIYTSIMDMKTESIQKHLRLSERDSVKIVRREIDYPGAQFVDDRFPLLRRTEGKRNGRPPNVVLVLLESWTGRFIEGIGESKVEGKEVAPYFNALTKKGRFFTKFFASGGRTTNGMMSILAGVPDRPGLTVFRTHQVMGNFSTIADILGGMGYDTYFYTGGDLSFDNLITILPQWGFEKVRGKNYMERLERYKLGAWGYNDADVLELMNEEISGSDKPFLAVCLTLTTHYPYGVPDPKFAIFPERVRDWDFLNSYHYADWAIHNFLEKAKQKEYFDNTVFLFVSDHTHHRFLDYYQDRNIPFLIYAPKLVKPGVDKQIGSQLDVIPTILSLVGKETEFSAMGKDLLSPGRKQSAYFAYGNLFGWIEDNLFYFQFTDSGKSIEYTVEEPHEETRLCDNNKESCSNHLQKAKAYLNLTYTLLNENRVFPGKQEKK